MSWFYLTILSVIITSFANILQRVLMKGDKSNPYSYAIFFHLLVGSLNLIFAFVHGFHLPQLNTNLIFFLIAAILWGGGTVFLFKALQLLEASEVTILGSIEALVTLIGSGIFLHEFITGQKILGLAIVLGAVALASRLKEGLKFNKGVLFAFTMTILYGSATVIDAFIVKSYDPISYLALANLLIAVVLFLSYPKVLTQFSDFTQPSFLKKMIPLGILSSSQAIAFYVALSIGGHVAQMGSINQAQVILTVLLAVIFLNEKDNLSRKIFAGILATLGVILLS